MKNSLGVLLDSLASMREALPPQNSEQAKTYAVLEYETARINTELVQLLSLYHLQQEHLLVQVDRHHVIDILDEQLARNEVLFKSCDIQLTINCDENLSWYLMANLSEVLLTASWLIVHAIVANTCMFPLKSKKTCFVSQSSMTAQGILRECWLHRVKSAQMYYF
jgi:signal transduction histidine kinase